MINQEKIFAAFKTEDPLRNKKINIPSGERKWARGIHRK